MSALPTAPKTYTPESGGRQMYALTFASSVAHLLFEEGDLCCGMMGDRARLVAQLWNDGLISKLIDRGLLAPVKPCKAGYPFALKLDRTHTVSFSYEWCGEMWKAAALCVIDLIAPALNWRGRPHRWFPPATERLQSDLVLALA